MEARYCKQLPRYCTRPSSCSVRRRLRGSLCRGKSTFRADLMVDHLRGSHTWITHVVMQSCVCDAQVFCLPEPSC